MSTSNYGAINRYEDDISGVEFDVHTRIAPLSELGATGLKHSAGFVDEEFLPALRGRKAIAVFKEMSLNDPIVGALLFAIDKLLRQVEYRVEAPDHTPKGAEAAKFLEECMDDMSTPWGDVISEILTMLTYGWSFHEVVYKKRIGPFEKDPKKRSKYTDGKIGWRKIAIRSQETLQRWVFDQDGDIAGTVQLAPPKWGSIFIPIDKALLFRVGSIKGNPEGQSLLRNAYRPWFFKKRMEEFEAIGMERDLAGMPVAKIPAKYMNAQANTKDAKTFAAFKKMVSNVRRDEHEGLVLPNEYDPETKQPLYEFELMSAGGARQFDTNAVITRYEQRILGTVLADFILLGTQSTGSYAMHVDKTGIFRTALNTIAITLADVFNRYAIPRLFEINGIKLTELPKIVPNNVDPPDLTQLSSFMTSMGSLGMEWFPDPELEKYLRGVARVPALPEEVLEMRRQMAQQSQMMSYANSQMELLGMKQKAEMTAQGFSPEQAQLAAQQPTPEMATQETAAATIGQYKGQREAMKDPDVKRGVEDEAKQAQGEQAQAFTMDQEAKNRDALRQDALKEEEGRRGGGDKDADRKHQMMLERFKARQRPQNGSKR